MNLPSLDERLQKVSCFVRNGAFVADIGTDHAYLPIYLILMGKVELALASDINSGPVEHARQSVKKFNVADKITIIQSDGLDKIKDYPVTDIIIAGMGGELIASIMSKSDFIKQSDLRFILQPMTHPEILRNYLLSNEFSIDDEDLAYDEKDDKIYQIMCVSYSQGVKNDYTSNELLLGRHNIKRCSKNFLRLCKKTKDINLKIKNAKKKSAQSTIEQDAILDFVEKYL